MSLMHDLALLLQIVVSDDEMLFLYFQRFYFGIVKDFIF